MYIQNIGCIDTSCRCAGVVYFRGWMYRFSCETVLTTQCRLPARGSAKPLAGNPGNMFDSLFDSRSAVCLSGILSGRSECGIYEEGRLRGGGSIQDERFCRNVSSAIEADSSEGQETERSAENPSSQLWQVYRSSLCSLTGDSQVTPGEVVIEWIIAGPARGETFDPLGGVISGGVLYLSFFTSWVCGCIVFNYRVGVEN